MNSAGIVHATGLLVRNDGTTVHTNDIRKVFEVNVIGTLNVVKHAA